MTAARELAADQQPDPIAPERSRHVAEHGTQPAKPELFLAAADGQHAFPQIDGLMNQASGSRFNLTQLESQWQQQYPSSYDASVSSSTLATAARARWQTAMSGYQQTMQVQSQIVQNGPGRRTGSGRSRQSEPGCGGGVAGATGGQSAYRALHQAADADPDADGGAIPGRGARTPPARRRLRRRPVSPPRASLAPQPPIPATEQEGRRQK